MDNVWDMGTWSDQELREFLGRLPTSQMERSLQEGARDEARRRGLVL